MSTKGKFESALAETAYQASLEGAELDSFGDTDEYGAYFSLVQLDELLVILVESSQGFVDVILSATVGTTSEETLRAEWANLVDEYHEWSRDEGAFGEEW